MPIGMRLWKEARPAAARKAQAKEKPPILADPQEARSTAPELAAAGNGRKILVVDDDPVVLKAFETRLKRDGFSVTTLGNAAVVASTAAEQKVDLIVLDINFPASGAMEWNGFTVIQWLRRFAELGEIPVILISSGEAAQYKEKAMQAGALAFFEKPVDYKAFLAAIQQAVPV